MEKTEPLHSDVKSAIKWVYENTDNVIYESTDAVIRVNANGSVHQLRKAGDGMHFWERMVRH